MVSILECGPTFPGWMVIPMLCVEMVHDHPVAVLSIGVSAALAINIYSGVKLSEMYVLWLASLWTEPRRKKKRDG